MKKSVRNVVIGTALLTGVAAYVAYNFYKKNKNKDGSREVVHERNYTVIGSHAFSNKDEEEKSKVM